MVTETKHPEKGVYSPPTFGCAYYCPMSRAANLLDLLLRLGAINIRKRISWLNTLTLPFSSDYRRLL